MYLIFSKKMSMSPTQAKQHFRSILKQAKKDSDSEGMSYLPPNYGDVRLKKEATDEGIRAVLTKIRKEGVKDEDIRWWWNLHDLERRMIVAVDNVSRLAMFTDCLKNGMNPEDAAKRIRRAFPMFGNPDDTTHSFGNDRPLPHELKDRINVYIEKRSKTDLEQFKRDIARHSTFNALIREEISNGEIL